MFHTFVVLMMSGLLLTEDVKWMTFHSGYDFGYLLKTLTCESLPEEESQFLGLRGTFLTGIYDVKFMMTLTDGLYGGLSALADSLEVVRVGPEHQAGSDSLLTAQTYFAIMRKHFADQGPEKFRGELYGLGNNHTRYKSKHFNSSNNNNNNNNNSSLGNQGPLYIATPGVHFGSSANGLYPMGGNGPPLSRQGSFQSVDGEDSNY